MAIDPLLIDTNAFAAMMRGDREAQNLVRSANRVCMSVVVLGELLAGFRLGSREAQNREYLNEFLGWMDVSVVPIDLQIAEAYSSLLVALRKAGTPIPTNDLWVAATALCEDLVIFTYDRHFRSVPGVRSGSSLEELRTLNR